jgi:hypothetical protein
MIGKQIDLTSAERIYSVSNVPLFLLRKLQADPSINRISSSLSTNEILGELKKSLQVKPRTLGEAVKPYVLLVALGKKGQIEPLKEASAIEAPYHDWFSYLAEVLLHTFISTGIISLNVHGQFSTTLPANTSTASTRKLILSPLGN